MCHGVGLKGSWYCERRPSGFGRHLRQGKLQDHGRLCKGTTLMEGNGGYINLAAAEQHKFLSPLFICSVNNAALHYDPQQIALPFYSFDLMCNHTNFLSIFWRSTQFKKIILLLIFWRLILRSSAMTPGESV